ncbi:hypothetical protein AUR64_07310 [Haloprofundus marisrubri]|uniref:Uncharacterized protein n=1 Tax=Haloprofundus marisrubri TaxID=1514971 RepID=A0A0W1RC58_9EURY|nr:hypothetical protein [Haloprofundus marisrubri]KTG10971.1 hypothetical protein AUR64_07310 [Haloprofundus marisrubri]
MEQYDTAEGDDVRVVFERGRRVVVDDLSLSLRRRPDEEWVDGVLTTSDHADIVHELFAREEPFRIRLEPVGSDEAVVFENCRFLSSSGKWTTAGE